MKWIIFVAFLCLLVSPLSVAQPNGYSGSELRGPFDGTAGCQGTVFPNCWQNLPTSGLPNGVIQAGSLTTDAGMKHILAIGIDGCPYSFNVQPVNTSGNWWREVPNVGCGMARIVADSDGNTYMQRTLGGEVYEWNNSTNAWEDHGGYGNGLQAGSDRSIGIMDGMSRLNFAPRADQASLYGLTWWNQANYTLGFVQFTMAGMHDWIGYSTYRGVNHVYLYASPNSELYTMSAGYSGVFNTPFTRVTGCTFTPHSARGSGVLICWGSVGTKVGVTLNYNFRTGAWDSGQLGTAYNITATAIQVIGESGNSGATIPMVWASLGWQDTMTITGQLNNCPALPCPTGVNHQAKYGTWFPYGVSPHNTYSSTFPSTNSVNVSTNDQTFGPRIDFQGGNGSCPFGLIDPFANGCLPAPTGQVLCLASLAQLLPQTQWNPWQNCLLHPLDTGPYWKGSGTFISGGPKTAVIDVFIDDHTWANGSQGFNDICGALVGDPRNLPPNGIGGMAQINGMNYNCRSSHLAPPEGAGGYCQNCGNRYIWVQQAWAGQQGFNNPCGPPHDDPGYGDHSGTWSSYDHNCPWTGSTIWRAWIYLDRNITSRQTIGEMAHEEGHDNLGPNYCDPNDMGPIQKVFSALSCAGLGYSVMGPQLTLSDVQPDGPTFCDEIWYWLQHQ